MLKKTILIFILPIALLQIQCNKKENELLKKVDRDIQKIDYMQNMENFRISFSNGTKNDTFDEEDSSNFENLSKLKPEDKELELFFNQEIQVRQKLIHPYNHIALETYNYKLKNLLGISSALYNNGSYTESTFPLYEITKITFKDKSILIPDSTNIISDKYLEKHYTVEEVDEDDGEIFKYIEPDLMPEFEKFIYYEQSFDKNYGIKTAKPIDHIDIGITLPLINYTPFLLDFHTKKTNTGLGEIILDTITSQHVALKVPKKLGDNMLLTAYYKDDRILKQRGRNSTTIPTPSEKKYFSKVRGALLDAKEWIKKDSIKTETDLDKYIENATVKTTIDSTEIKYTNLYYSFSGPISSLQIWIPDTEIELKKFNINYKLYYNKNEEKSSYFVSHKFGTENCGIIDVNGKWIVQPNYNEHLRPLNSYYYWDQFNDDSNTYHLNHKTKTFEKISYVLKDRDIYGDKYVIILKKPYDYNTQGIANAITGKIIFSPKYDNIEYQNGFWIVKDNNEAAIYNNQFTKVVHGQLNNIETDGKYIYATSKTGGKTHDEIYIYHSNGDKLPINANNIKGHFSNGLLLIGAYTTNTETGHLHYNSYFVNNHGNKIIDVTKLGYRDAKPFSCGLATVENQKGQYGFINTSGKLVIPCHYYFARPFFTRSQYALVTKDKEDMLIDKNGNIIKTFPYKISIKDNYTEKYNDVVLYSYEDKKWYDVFGDEIVD
ncbi:MAG: WG repeat-containing protein [Aestuariibaculum sp.]